MTNFLEHLPSDIPEFMTIPYVAKRALTGYKSVSSVKKLIVGEELVAVNLAEEGEANDSLRISRKSLIDYWERKSRIGKDPSPVKPQQRTKSPSRTTPRKRSK